MIAIEVKADMFCPHSSHRHDRREIPILAATVAHGEVRAIFDTDERCLSARVLSSEVSMTQCSR